MQVKGPVEGRGDVAALEFVHEELSGVAVLIYWKNKWPQVFESLKLDLVIFCESNAPRKV